MKMSSVAFSQEFNPENEEWIEKAAHKLWRLIEWVTKSKPSLDVYFGACLPIYSDNQILNTKDKETLKEATHVIKVTS